MANIEYKLITSNNSQDIELIADWYFKEWNIPIQTSINKIEKLSVENNEFQVLMTFDNEPIATAGLYNHVGLLNQEPKFNIYSYWLALVFTKPEFRGKGVGSLICQYVQNHAKSLGLENIYLFTHTAESLYKRLEWQELERITLGGKDIVVMKKDL